MSFPRFIEQPLWLNFVVFSVAAGLVWWSGTRLSEYVDLFAERTQLGRAFAGALLLGGVTSLPELATSLTASFSGAAQLAGYNLLGGVAMQMAVLALIDAVVLRGKALTFFSPRSALLMHGVVLVSLLGLLITAVSSGELLQIGHVGLWSLVLAAAYLISLWQIYRYENDSRWEPAGEIGQPPESARDLKDARDEAYKDVATREVVLRFVVAATGVLIGGVLVAQTAEALAELTGLGQNFVGATLVALTTSLPEVSTTWSAVRFGAYSMAAANILGTNSLTVALFFPADLAYREGAILNEFGGEASLLAAVGIVVTGVYLWGILERRDRTVFGMGFDSAIVVVVYLLGLALFSRIG